MSFNRHHAVVLTEQKSRFILVARQADKTSLTTAGSIKKLLAGLPRRARASITFDNGGEFARHKSLGFATYFCDPHSPWQRGQSRTPSADCGGTFPMPQAHGYSDADFQQLITIYNDTPRKCLDYRTPAEAMLQEIRKRLH